MSARGQFYSLRGSVRLARFRLRHHRPSLDRAIADLDRSAALLPTGHPDRPLVLCALSNGLLWRYELTGGTADLTEAVRCLREAIASPGLPAAERAASNGDLAAVLRSRFLRYGDAADLDEAIRAATDAVRNAADPASAVTNRALALLARYEEQARTADLLAALQDARQPASGFLHRGLRLGALIGALSARYQFTDDPDDLHGAIVAGRQALATLSRTDPNRALYATELSTVLRTSGDPELRAEAVAVAEEAVRDSAPGHVDHALRLSTWSMALLMRHLDTGDRDDLRRARDLAGQALAAGGPGRAQLLQRAGLLARRWHQVSGEPAALADGEQALREAMAAATPGSPLHAALGADLAELLLQAPDGRATEIRELLTTAVRAAGPALSLHNALRAAARLAEVATGTGHLPAALLGYRRAVELLPTAAWPGLRRAVREARLAAAPRATDAAAVAIRAGDPELAVELLDAGRSVLWSQDLDRHTDLSRLRAVAPDVAGRMDEIRAWAERPTTQAAPDRAMRLAGEWDDLVAQVRELPGFTDFRRPLKPATLRAAARGGPVVILNVSRWRCDALIVRASGVDVVELPDVTEDRVREQVGHYLTAVGARQSEAGRDLGPAGPAAGGTALDDCLQWMWAAFAEPVLDRLGYSAPPAEGDDWPRVWWCPTGPLTLLPLHAAGEHGTPGAAVLDRVISSYTPTLRALREARDRPGPDSAAGPGGRMLFAGMPVTPGRRDLPDVLREEELLGRLFAGRCTRLIGPAATRDRVRTELAAHDAVHFACHGEQDLDDPSRGGVLLHDGRLTVAEFGAQRRPAELAYLSGCKTAVGGTALPDEAISLAAALQYTGYRHVIATLWSVGDASAAQVAAEVYGSLVHDGVFDAHHAARALHEAVRRLRETYPDRPGVWTPFAHFGP